MTKGLVRANNFSDLADKDEAAVNLGLSAADYAALKGLYTTAGIDFAVIGEIGNSQGNYQAQLDGIGTTLSGVVLSGYVNRSGDTILGTWTHSGIINISSGLPSGYPASTDSLFSLSIESGEAVIVASGLIASGLSYNGVRQSSSTVQRAFPPSGFSPLHLIPLQVGGQSFFAEAGESPSFHIAPARTGHALDLVTGNLLGTYNSASPAWAVGPDGVLALPAANAPVIEYDPTTGACLGARIWGVVTNQIRNNTMVGAVAGTPGTLPTNWTVAGFSGLTRQIVGIGTFQGVNYVDIRFSGTATGTFGDISLEAQTVIAAANNQAWTGSAWIQVIGGSTLGVTTITLSANQFTSSGAYIAATSNGAISFPVSTTFRRLSRSHTTNQATTAYLTPLLQIGFTNGAAIDITLRIGLPQLEQSATMGPVVKTSGLAASSTADVWSIMGADFSRIYNQSAVTLYGEAERDVVPANEFMTIMSANDGSNSNRVRIGYFSEVYATGTVTYNNVAVADLYPLASGRRRRVALAATENDAACVFNGGNVATDASLTMPTVGQLNIGALPTAGGYLNGYIREAAIFRSRRPNANLQAMTS